MCTNKRRLDVCIVPLICTFNQARQANSFMCKVAVIAVIRKCKACISSTKCTLAKQCQHVAISQVVVHITSGMPQGTLDSGVKRTLDMGKLASERWQYKTQFMGHMCSKLGRLHVQQQALPHSLHRSVSMWAAKLCSQQQLCVAEAYHHLQQTRRHRTTSKACYSLSLPTYLGRRQ